MLGRTTRNLISWLKVTEFRDKLFRWRRFELINDVWLLGYVNECNNLLLLSLIVQHLGRYQARYRL